MEETITEYLSYIGYSISKKYVEKLILSHTDYPAIVSVADVLKQLGITAQLGKIKKNTNFRD